MSDDTTFEDVGRWAAILLGMVLAVPVVVVLSSQAPEVLLAGLVVGFLAWAGIRTGVLAPDDEGEESAAVDPVATLQDRYAAGEISEAEFERRLDRLLESDERADHADSGGVDVDAMATESEPVRERE